MVKFNETVLRIVIDGMDIDLEIDLKIRMFD